MQMREFTEPVLDLPNTSLPSMIKLKDSLIAGNRLFMPFLCSASCSLDTNDSAFVDGSVMLSFIGFINFLLSELGDDSIQISMHLCSGTSSISSIRLAEPSYDSIRMLLGSGVLNDAFLALHMLPYGKALIRPCSAYLCNLMEYNPVAATDHLKIFVGSREIF